MDTNKLVGARKRKPVCISKITEVRKGSSDEEEFDRPDLRNIKHILDELKMKKKMFGVVSSSFVYPMCPPVYPMPLVSSDVQEAPLDLSMDAVDLSRNNSTSSLKREPHFSPPPLQTVRQKSASPVDSPLDLIKEVKKVSKGVKEVSSSTGKPKQRRYRTERPFACPHCPARFTLRSNMERHGKHQHGSVWQRSPSNRVLNKQKQLSSGGSPHNASANIRSVLSSKLKRKLSSATSDSSECQTSDLTSVENLIKFSATSAAGTVEEDEDEWFQDESEEDDEYVGKKTSAYSSAPHKISCPHCSRRFPWTSSLRRHLLTHTGQKPYQCSKCPLLFTTKSNCDRHLIRKHNSNGIQEEEEEEEEEEEGISPGPSFRCHMCEEMNSQSREEVLVHMETDHSEVYEELIGEVVSVDVPGDEGTGGNSNRKVLCAFCLRRFWSVEDLRRHIRSHTGERPFSCEFCSRRFTLKHSMLRHLRKHKSKE